MRLNRTGWAGLALLGLALVYPVWAVTIGWLAAASTRVDVPLLDGQTDLPVHVALTGNFTGSITGGTGEAGCLLGLPVSSYPDPCAGTKDTLRFHFQLLDAAGRVVKGNYGVALEGDYPDGERDDGVFQGKREEGVEFILMQPLRRGDYRLQMSGVRMPGALREARPRVEFGEASDPYGGLAMLYWLLLSALLGVAGGVALGVGLLLMWRQSRRPQRGLESHEKTGFASVFGGFCLAFRWYT